jgi:hypothetical protein
VAVAANIGAALRPGGVVGASIAGSTRRALTRCGCSDRRVMWRTLARLRGESQPASLQPAAECWAVAVGLKAAYGQRMTTPAHRTQPAAAGVRANAVVHRPQFGVDEPDRRFFGPQVPTENPVNWIAERAPPRAA